MESNKRCYEKYNSSICFKDEKENHEHELKLIEAKNNLQRDISASLKMKDDVKTLKDKKSELQECQEKKANGFIVWARAENVEEGENILSSLQILKKKRASAKTIKNK